MPLTRVEPARGRGVLACAMVIAMSTSGGTAAAQSAGQWHAPQEVYAKICAYCHETGVGPGLKGRFLPGVYIATVVRSGRNGMPAFRPSEISVGELDVLAKWLESSVLTAKP